MIRWLFKTLRMGLPSAYEQAREEYSRNPAEALIIAVFVGLLWIFDGFPRYVYYKRWDC